MKTNVACLRHIGIAFFVFHLSFIHAQVDLLKISQGSIQRHADFPSQYVSHRTVDVWLPNAYAKEKSYSVLYMHDGQLLYDSTITWNKQEWDVDTAMQRLIDRSLVRETIVVGIHNVNSERHSDYFPQKPFASLPSKIQDSLLHLGPGEHGLFAKPVQSDNYLKFIVQELMPFINENYATRTGPDHTYIAGSSMGGLISWYALCEYPKIFGGAACLSTHWPGIFTVENNPIPDAFLNYLNHHLPDPRTHKVYFDYGTETLDALYEPFQLKADAIMEQNGYSERHWKTLKFEGKDHSENAWAERLHLPLLFLLGKE